MTASHYKLLTLGELIRGSKGSIRTGPFGTTLRASEYSAQGVPVVSVGEVGFGSLRIHDRTRRVGPAVLRRLPEYILQEGDIVFGRKGAVDRSATVRKAEHGWFLGSDGIRVRLGGGVNSRFVGYALQSEGVRKSLLSNATGTTMATLTQPLLESLPILLPNSREQDAIVAAIDDVTKLIDILEQLFTKKRDIKQGMMQAVFHEQLHGSTSSPLGELVRFMSGGTPTRSRAEFWEGSIPWISATTLKDFEVAQSDQLVTEEAVFAGSTMAPIDSVLILVRGSALHSEIRASIVTAPVCFNQDVKALVPVGEILPRFLTHSIHANADRLLRLVTSAGNTAGVLETKVLRSFEILVPPIYEQAQIISVFDTINSEIQVLDQQLAKFRDIKTGMMQALLSGQTRLQVEEATL